VSTNVDCSYLHILNRMCVL